MKNYKRIDQEAKEKSLRLEDERKEKMWRRQEMKFTDELFYDNKNYVGMEE